MNTFFIVLFLSLFYSTLKAETQCQKWQDSPEKTLLFIIDSELYQLVKYDENWQWTSDYGLQPTDTYELDYYEKCLLFLRETKKEDVKCACELI